MNIRIINTIIGREYLTRVQKKSFLVTTFVVPILFAALCIIPVVMMMNSKEKVKHIGVCDASGIVMPYLEDTETIDYTDFCDYPADSLKNHIADFSLDAVLSISALDPQTKSLTADLTFPKPLGMEMCQNITNRINDAVEQYRIDSYNIANLAEILKDVKPDIHLNTYTINDEGDETISEAGVYSALSMILGLLLFLFITLFGGMVMSAVIEEKSSRVVEVLISSVKATELMFGKIIGVALVALTQFLLWIVLSAVLVGGAMTLMGDGLKEQLNPAALVQGTSGIAGMDASQLGGIDAAQLLTVDASKSAAAAEASNASAAEADAGVEAAAADTLQAPASELTAIVGALSTIPVGKFVIVFLVFFLFGYILYASLFAAIGSAVENEGDSQQLQLPVTIPLMIGYFIAIYAFNAPDSAIAFWGSIIPFTSPIVMLSRLPFGVPGWELALSIVLLVLTCVLCAWISAKIYKVGILMFGKKSTWRDLWNWLKQK